MCLVSRCLGRVRLVFALQLSEWPNEAEHPALICVHSPTLSTSHRHPPDGKAGKHQLGWRRGACCDPRKGGGGALLHNATSA